MLLARRCIIRLKQLDHVHAKREVSAIWGLALRGELDSVRGDRGTLRTMRIRVASTERGKDKSEGKAMRWG